MCHVCHIIPQDVLKRFAQDTSLSDQERDVFKHTAQIDVEQRKIRFQAGKLTQLSRSLAPAMGLAGAALATAPTVAVYDCGHGQTLPGAPIAAPNTSPDVTAKRVFVETSSLATFYSQIFKRNSIDDAGMTLLSSIHYGVRYNNAFWNGTQMTYGDGDGSIFVDFSQGNDVIGHELTHGVTQHTLQLNYANEPGGLNESLSDCFGSMFRQWEAQQDVQQADWLIGKDIMGPAALQKGYTCLRDMSDPAAKHCLAPQITHYSQYATGMDPHTSSGVPNRAFCAICKAVGGNSWDRVGQVWYRVMTSSGPKPAMKMKTFANLTRTVAGQLYPGDVALANAVDAGWKQVGL